MIKLKKIVAVALSAAMCLGLSMTAFAAKDTTWTNDDLWSPNFLKEIGPGGTMGAWEEYVEYSTEVFTEEGGAQYVVNSLGNKVYVSDLLVDASGNLYYIEADGTKKEVGFYANKTDFTSARDAKGHRVDISWRTLSEKTLKSIDEESKIADIFKKNGYDVPDDTDFIPLLTGNITFDEGVPEGGGIVTFQMADLGINSEGVQPGETVYVMQETAPGSGVWEVYAATVGQDLDVVVTLPRNGALVLVKTLSDGTVITLDKTTGNVIDRKPADNTANNNAANNNANNNASGSTSTSSVAAGATSPKTGEF